MAMWLKRPIDRRPEILYWLAVVDRALDYSLFYSMADLYLKQCIVGYADHPYAAKCFNLYKDYVNFSFTGSRGTYIPEPVMEELDRLEKLVKTSAN